LKNQLENLLIFCRADQDSLMIKLTESQDEVQYKEKILVFIALLAHAVHASCSINVSEQNARSIP